MNSYLKSKSILLFLIAGLVASFVVVSMPKTAIAATYSPGCYITFAGATTYTPATCPVSNSDDAARYAGKCWLATTNGQAQSSYKEFNCDTGTASSGPTSSSSGSGSVNPLGEFKATPDADKILEAKNTKTCGSGPDNEVKVAFDFGCVGPAYGKPLNPIIDIAFAIFRFLSAGVGLIVIGSIIVAGLQYSASRGNPQATQAAIKRITSSIVALFIYIFIFAFANYLVPGGMFL